MKKQFPQVQFLQPSTATIKTAHAVIQKQHTVAKEQIAVTAKDLNEILDLCPATKAIITQAQFDLSKAKDAVEAADAATSQAEGARDQLDEQLKEQTDSANALASDYAKSESQITSLKESRHSFVKLSWELGGLLVAALAFIFRKPLFALLGGIGI